MSIPAEAYRLHSIILKVEKGLHIFRYEGATDEKSPPFYVIAPIPDDIDALEYMSDSTNGGNLCKPGDCLIIKATRQIKIIATKGFCGALRKDHVELSFMPLKTSGRKPNQPVLAAASPVSALPPPKSSEQPKVAYVQAESSAVQPSRGAAASATASGIGAGGRYGESAAEDQNRPAAALNKSIRCSVKTVNSPDVQVFSVPDVPSTFDSPVKTIAFASPDRRGSGVNSLRLTAFYSDGRQAVFEGRDVAATALGMTTISGVRLQSLMAGSDTAAEVLNCLFAVADTVSQKSANAVQQTLVRRRVGVVMDL